MSHSWADNHLWICLSRECVLSDQEFFSSLLLFIRTGSAGGPFDLQRTGSCFENVPSSVSPHQVHVRHCHTFTTHLSPSQETVATPPQSLISRRQNPTRHFDWICRGKGTFSEGLKYNQVFFKKISRGACRGFHHVLTGGGVLGVSGLKFRVSSTCLERRTLRSNCGGKPWTVGDSTEQLQMELFLGHLYFGRDEQRNCQCVA